MAIVNANTPLVDKTTNQQFYPLTAYNQVIMPNGSRWDGNTNKCPYDIGDIFYTTNATNPSDRWAGTTWESITSFLLGASEAHPAGETGGEETHRLTIEEIPSHTHDVNGSGLSLYMDYIGTGSGLNRIPDGRTPEPQNPLVAQATGGGQPHNNMPPYLSVYIWKRVG